MSDEKDILKDLFSEKLGNYEAKVKPELWNSIASKIGTTAVTSGTVGKTILSKIIIGSSIAAAVAVGGYALFSPSKMVDNNHTETIKKEVLIKKTVQPLTSPKQEVSEVKKENLKPLNSKEELPIDFIKENITQTIKSNRCLGNSSIYKNDIKEEIISKIDNSSETTEQKPLSNVIPLVKEDLQKEPVSFVQPEENSIENLPNVFTPNNDGSNDDFSIKSYGIKDFSIVVMDNQNNVVFKSEDADFKWNGVDLKGDQVPEGNYIYYVTGYNSKGKVITKYSTLKIMR